MCIGSGKKLCNYQVMSDIKYEKDVIYTQDYITLIIPGDLNFVHLLFNVSIEVQKIICA